MKILYHVSKGFIVAFTRLLFGTTVRGIENLPSEEGCIMAPNHISYFDPPFVGSWLSRPTYFLAKKELFDYPLFDLILRQVNALPIRRGSIDRKATELTVRLLKEGSLVTIFPEGTRGRNGVLLPPRPGIGVIALNAGCSIVPVYVHGTDKMWDCFLRRDRLSVTLGKPIAAEWIRSQSMDRAGYEKIASEVMERIRKLKMEVSGS